MNSLDKQYQVLLQDILDNGVVKNTRNGEVLSVFGRTVRHKMSDGFSLITTKKMAWKQIVTELLWFLRGDTNIKFLLDNNCHIWDGDAYKNYEQEWLKENPPMSGPYTEKMLSKEEFINKIKRDDEFANKWGDLGQIYGKQWRQWQAWMEYENDGVKNQGSLWYDQIGILIHELKTKPDSRRLIVNSWNVGDLDKMALPPCHYGFQIYTRELSLEERMNLWNNAGKNDGFLMWARNGSQEKALDHNRIPKRAISLSWTQRSCDFPLGIPFNIASYGLLLEIIGKIVNMVPEELIGNLGDCHIYQNQIEGVKEQLERESYSLPIIRINTEFWPTQSRECGIGELTGDIDLLIQNMQIDDFQIENYKSHPPIKIPLSN